MAAATLAVVGLGGRMAHWPTSTVSPNFTLNGGATSDGTTLTVTDGAGEAQAHFRRSMPRQNVTSFTTSFTYTDVGGGGRTGSRSLFTTIRAVRPRWATPVDRSATGETPRLLPSAADSFNIFGTAGSGYRTNGNKETGPTGPVNIGSGNPINVTLRYTGPTLTETLTDTVTGATSFKAYAANIPAAVGASTGYVGFTGGTGGVASTQTISNFTLNNATAVARHPAAGGHGIQSGYRGRSRCDQ